jgi:hypothetical protein
MRAPMIKRAMTASPPTTPPTMAPMGAFDFAGGSVWPGDGSTGVVGVELFDAGDVAITSQPTR